MHRSRRTLRPQSRSAPRGTVRRAWRSGASNRLHSRNCLLGRLHRCSVGRSVRTRREEERMIVVVARLQAKPGHEAEVEEILRGLIPLTRAEAGCLSYHLHVQEGDPTSFLFFEQWESDEALNTHLTTPHI